MRAPTGLRAHTLRQRHLLGEDLARDTRDDPVDHLGCHTVRGTYGTAEAGARTQYVRDVAPWGQAALRLWYVHYARGWYA